MYVFARFVCHTKPVHDFNQLLRHVTNRIFHQSKQHIVQAMYVLHTYKKQLNRKISTGKYFSEALILASTIPQYDKRLFIKLQIQYMKIASSEHVLYINCSE